MTRFFSKVIAIIDSEPAVAIGTLATAIWSAVQASSANGTIHWSVAIPALLGAITRFAVSPATAKPPAK